MNRYIEFNPDKFLKDARKWAKEKRDSQKQLDSILELSAVSNTEVHTNNISDPTRDTAIKKLMLEAEIDRLDNYQCILEYGLSRIDELERKLLNAFYWSDTYLNRIVDDFCNDLDCSPRHVYKLKRKALDHFAQSIEHLI